MFQGGLKFVREALSAGQGWMYSLVIKLGAFADFT